MYTFPYFKFAFFFTLFLSTCFFSQKSNFDSLSYKEIEKKIDESNRDSIQLWTYIKLYITKSKDDDDKEALLYAYRYASIYSTSPRNLRYADSAIAVGKKSGDEKLLTNAYLNRGFVYMNEALYQQALDDILTADKFTEESGDQYEIHKTRYLVAQNKIYLGLYEDANKEILECVDYFKKNVDKNELGKDYQIYYIYSLMSLIDSNTKIGKSNENKKLISEAMDFLKVKNLSQYYPYFISSEGTDAFYSKNYPLAISKLSKAIKMYDDQWPHLTEVFYIGRSHWKLKNYFTAVKYFEEIDKVYSETKKLDPNFRSAYEYLIKYNDSLGNKDAQLEYIDKLMTLDRSYEKNYRYLFTKINKEYDTAKLIEQKTKIEQSLAMQKVMTRSILIVCIIVLIVFGIRFYFLNQAHKKRFEELMEELRSKEIQNSNIEDIQIPATSMAADPKEMDYTKIQGINPAIVEQLLHQLSNFELEHGYLDPQLSSKLLSERLGTNSTYLSRTINVYKGKNYNNYINDLRLDYIIDLMKNDTRYQNMDVKELSYEAGFMNSENFSDNFQRKFQIKPSYFIKKVREKKYLQ